MRIINKKIRRFCACSNDQKTNMIKQQKYRLTKKDVISGSQKDKCDRYINRQKTLLVQKEKTKWI